MGKMQDNGSDVWHRKKIYYLASPATHTRVLPALASVLVTVHCCCCARRWCSSPSLRATATVRSRRAVCRMPPATVYLKPFLAVGLVSSCGTVEPWRGHCWAYLAVPAWTYAGSVEAIRADYNRTAFAVNRATARGGERFCAQLGPNAYHLGKRTRAWTLRACCRRTA
jgi:hypothetical protein